MALRVFSLLERTFVGATFTWFIDLCVVSLKPLAAEMSAEQAHCQLSCSMVAKGTGAKKVSLVLYNRAGSFVSVAGLLVQH